MKSDIYHLAMHNRCNSMHFIYPSYNIFLLTVLLSHLQESFSLQTSLLS